MVYLTRVLKPRDIYQEKDFRYTTLQLIIKDRKLSVYVLLMRLSLLCDLMPEDVIFIPVLQIFLFCSV